MNKKRKSLCARQAETRTRGTSPLKHVNYSITNICERVVNKVSYLTKSFAKKYGDRL